MKSTNSISTILVILVVLIYMACTNPVWDIDRSGEEDLSHPYFELVESTDLTISFDSTGTVNLQWEPGERPIDGYIIEKSLGDTTDFFIIGRTDSDAIIFEDTSRIVRKDTYYRVTAYVTHKSKDIHIERYSSLLQFRAAIRTHISYDPERNRIIYTWIIDNPFITHYALRSSHPLNTSGDTLITIQSAGRSNSIIDELTHVDFERREIALTGYIIGDDFTDMVIETSISFNASAVFSPDQFNVNIQNERDWQLSWTNRSYFEDGFRIYKRTGGQQNQYKLIATVDAGTSTYLDTTFEFSGSERGLNNIRSYTVEAYIGSSTSEPAAISKHLEHGDSPIAWINYATNLIPSSVTIEWIIDPDDMIAGFIIERADNPWGPSLDFQVIATVDSDVRTYTDNTVTGHTLYYYRVSSLTGTYNKMIATAYTPNYSLDQALIDLPSPPTKMLASADGRYLAAISNGIIPSDGIYIWDLNTSSLLQKIQHNGQRITDFSINSATSQIFYAVPAENKIISAAFPSGGSKNDVLSTEPGARITHFDISNNAKILAGTGDQGTFISIWDLDEDRLVSTHNYESVVGTLPFRTMQLSPDETSLIAYNYEFLIKADVVDLSNYITRRTLRTVDIGFTGDGSYVYSIVNGRLSVVSANDLRTAPRSYSNVSALGSAAGHPVDNSIVLLYDENRMMTYTYDYVIGTRNEYIAEAWGRHPMFVKYLMWVSESRIAAGLRNGEILILRRLATSQWKQLN